MFFCVGKNETVLPFRSMRISKGYSNPLGVHSVTINPWRTQIKKGNERYSRRVHMKQVLLTGGGVVVVDVPAPNVADKHILVAVEYSCISAGTELAGIRERTVPLYKKVLRRPEKVGRMIGMVRDQGLGRTINRIRGLHSIARAMGYSAAGRVIEIGKGVEGFQVGDRVSCGGADVAMHAEIINVPSNLAVRLPPNLSNELAATVTLGAIALQGVRRANPTLGETFVVVGLGVIGQLAAQLLRVHGCHVVGVDLSSQRISIAVKNGMEYGIEPGREDYVAAVHRLTDGFGADAVLVTAASPEHHVISEAMRACRKKGRVVLVGDVGLHLKREDFYQKELDFLISTSYGPGRYDPTYESGGQDYPLPYVRWTENRNMQAYLRLLADGRINLDNFAQELHDVEHAKHAYSKLAGNDEKPLLMLLRYSEPQKRPERKVVVCDRISNSTQIRVAIVGAGAFAQGMHLPNIVKLRRDYKVHAIMSRTGANAKAIAQQYEARYATTDYMAILEDPDVDLLIITTRHHLHGSMVLSALRAGKNVFVEKPLAITPEELDSIESFFSNSQNAPVLMTGFNRRFSPLIAKVKKIIHDRFGPIMISYRMNAEYLQTDHWVHGKEGGGRNIGEACHIYDLFNHFTCSTVSGVVAAPYGAGSKQWGGTSNFCATISYDDGSVCNLIYTTSGHKSYPKERMDIFGDGKVISMDDYRNLVVVGLKGSNWQSKTQEKGQLEELESLAACIKSNRPWPISLEDQLNATRISYRVEEAVSGQRYPV